MEEIIKELLEKAKQNGSQASVILTEIQELLNGENPQIQDLLERAKQNGTQASVVLLEIEEILYGEEENLEEAKQNGSQSTTILVDLAENRPLGPIPVEGDIQIFADPECTQYATGVVDKVYVRINSSWGFDEECVIGDRNGSNNIALCSPTVRNPNSPYYVQLYADFLSENQSTPFTEGQVVECNIDLEHTGPTDVTDYYKVFTYTPEFVDLGLPSGTKWAKCNLGAGEETYYGKYFSWGNIDGVTSVDTEGIAAMTEAAYAQTKGATLTGDIPATAEYDAAVARFQGIADCQIPTNEQFQELINECTWKWQDSYEGAGNKGYLITSKANSNSIFLPAAGSIKNGSLITNAHCYWCNNKDRFGSVGSFGFDSSGHSGVSYISYIYIGSSIRPVQNA